MKSKKIWPGGGDPLGSTTNINDLEQWIVIKILALK